jgi:hypothetical protein
MDITRLKTAVTDSEVPWVGVAICRTSPGGGRHTGIIYRGVAGELRLADMAWHERFRDAPYEQRWDYYCAVPQFDDPLLEMSFADYCAHVAQALTQDKPPYNFLPPNMTVFDTNGKWISRDPDSGMNCSSFVVAVFESFNTPLVKVSTWPVGLPLDVQEQTALVAILFTSTNPNDASQALKISPQIGKHPRIRPEETAGACLEDESARPIDHAQCAENGKRVLEVWDQNHP